MGGRVCGGSAIGVLVGATVAAGCGASDDYANQLRPPPRLTIAASIGPRRIVLSPARFGAGPITLVVTNQTTRNVELVLETADAPGSGTTGKQQQSGPINPQGTLSLNADLTQGPWQLRAPGSRLPPAPIAVGPKRGSAQDQLLQP